MKKKKNKKNKKWPTTTRISSSYTHKAKKKCCCGSWCANKIPFFFLSLSLCYTHGTHIYIDGYMYIFSFLLDPYYMADDWIAFRYLCVCVALRVLKCASALVFTYRYRRPYMFYCRAQLDRGRQQERKWIRKYRKRFFFFFSSFSLGTRFINEWLIDWPVAQRLFLLVPFHFLVCTQHNRRHALCTPFNIFDIIRWDSADKCYINKKKKKQKSIEICCWMASYVYTSE